VRATLNPWLDGKEGREIYRLQFAQKENHKREFSVVLSPGELDMDWTWTARPADTKLICSRKIGTQLRHNSVFAPSFETANQLLDRFGSYSFSL